MSTETKTYDGTKEDMPVIGGFVATNLERDLPDFTAYSPAIDTEYLTGFKAQVAAVVELVTPQTEIANLRTVTARLYTTIDSLNVWLNKLNGYVKLAKLPALDFGIAASNRFCDRKNVEGLLEQLKVVANGIERHQTALTEKGLTEEHIENFNAMRVSISEDNQLQYKTTEARKTLVRDNMQMLNQLYAQIMEICSIGKIIYKGVNALKVKEYTFSELKKQARTKTKTA
jgi:hypothetical protein